MSKQHKDQFAKSIIEQYAELILRFFYEDADKLFDFDKGIEFLESEQIDIDKDPLTQKGSVRVDRLLKVHLKSGELAWIVINIEIQGYKEAAFAERVFKYFYNLFNKYGKRVAILSIYTDASNDNFMPDSFHYSLLGTTIAFNFKTYKVFNQNEAELANHPNPVALLFLAILIDIKNARKKNKSALLDQAIHLAETVYHREIDEKMKANLLKTIQLYFHFEKPEMQRKFGNKIDSFTNKIKTMNIWEFDMFIAVEKAKEDTRKETREETLLERDTVFVQRLLQKTSHTINEIADFVGVPLDFVTSLKAQLKN